MIRIFANASYDFIRVRRWAFLLALAFTLPGLVLLPIRGVPYSIEFTGGAEIQVRTLDAVPIARLRAALDGGGVAGAELRSFGSPHDFVIRARLTSGDSVTAATTEIVGQTVAQALDTELGTGNYEIVRTEVVGPKVGRELQGKAFLAILFSFITTLAYLAVRFEWRFGLAAVAATANDVLATIAFIRYLNLEVGLVVVAALLTVLGYSLNDKIVVFDRVRENLRKFRRQNFVELLNLSINETLPRTLLTGGTTIATALVLAFFAGDVIKPFALVMAFGIIFGTVSSMYIASPILLEIERRWPGRDARGVRALAGPGSAAPANPSVPGPGKPQPAR
ncbi:MAG TPA: protein translocase subunit SecF [Gemmatimonadales bacterium]